MPYELLYSRTIRGDGVVRYTDIPITDKSVMIEVLSLLSPFRRIAGYVYALRSDGISDYERSGGVTLPFGKNRVTFASATLPYGLEFFPKWGMKTGIISVYIGEPVPLPPPPNVWKQMPTGLYQMRLDTSPPGISYRTNPDDEALVVGSEGATEAVMQDDAVLWKNNLGEYFIRAVNTTYIAYAQSAVEMTNIRATPGTVVL